MMPLSDSTPAATPGPLSVERGFCVPQDRSWDTGRRPSGEWVISGCPRQSSGRAVPVVGCAGDGPASGRGGCRAGRRGPGAGGGVLPGVGESSRIVNCPEWYDGASSHKTSCRRLNLAARQSREGKQPGHSMLTWLRRRMESPSTKHNRRSTCGIGRSEMCCVNGLGAWRAIATPDLPSANPLQTHRRCSRLPHYAPDFG